MDLNLNSDKTVLTLTARKPHTFRFSVTILSYVSTILLLKIWSDSIWNNYQWLQRYHSQKIKAMGKNRLRKMVAISGKDILLRTWESLGLRCLVNPVGFFCCVLFFLFGHTTCRILVPRPGIEPIPPAVEVQSPNRWTARESLQWVLSYT